MAFLCTEMELVQGTGSDKVISDVRGGGCFARRQDSRYSRCLATTSKQTRAKPGHSQGTADRLRQLARSKTPRQDKLIGRRQLLVGASLPDRVGGASTGPKGLPTRFGRGRSNRLDYTSERLG